MNKLQWRAALENLITGARIAAWESTQASMIDAFESQELERLELCFNDNEEVGHIEELQELAQRFQINWAYENQCQLTAIF